MAQQPSFEDVQGCQNALYEWAESYDTKDWDRLSKCIAPTLRIDYSAVMNKIWEAMPDDEFLVMAANGKFLGNPRIKTQHFVGASKWISNGDDTITGHHQMRVAHQKYGDDDLKEVLVKGHGHGKAIILYRKVDGMWKFGGIEPVIRWFEFELDQIFEH